MGLSFLPKFSAVEDVEPSVEKTPPAEVIDAKTEELMKEADAGPQGADLEEASKIKTPEMPPVDPKVSAELASLSWQLKTALETNPHLVDDEPKFKDAPEIGTAPVPAPPMETPAEIVQSAAKSSVVVPGIPLMLNGRYNPAHPAVKAHMAAQPGLLAKIAAEK